MRARIAYKARVEAEKKMVRHAERDWTRLLTANDNAVAHVQHLFKGTMDEEGNVIKGLSAEEVKDIVHTIGKLAENESFMTGGPTGRIETRNMHLDMVDFLESLEEPEAPE